MRIHVPIEGPRDLELADLLEGWLRVTVSVPVVCEICHREIPTGETCAHQLRQTGADLIPMFRHPDCAGPLDPAATPEAE